MKTEVKTVLGIRDEEVLLGDATGAVQAYSFDAFDFPPVFGDKVAVISFDNGSVRVIREGASAPAAPMMTAAAAAPLHEAAAAESAAPFFPQPAAAAPAPAAAPPVQEASPPVMDSAHDAAQAGPPDESPPSAGRDKGLAIMLAIGVLAAAVAVWGKKNNICTKATDFLAPTPLMYSAREGHAPNVRCLLASGADPNERDHHGGTALHRTSDPGIARLLIEKGADVNAASENGYTALIWAAERGDTDLVRLLLDKGANVNATSKKGTTALMFAAERGRTETARLLLERGAAVGAAAKNGKTALMSAAFWNRPDTVRLLIEKGANVNAAAKDGTTALSIAREESHADIVQMLKAAGAKE